VDDIIDAYFILNCAKCWWFYRFLFKVKYKNNS
jgi:hypothetical protein